MRYIFSEDDLAVMDQVRRVFDPDRHMNPGKLFPTDGAERPRPHAAQARRAAGASISGEEPWI